LKSLPRQAGSWSAQENCPKEPYDLPKETKTNQKSIKENQWRCATVTRRQSMSAEEDCQKEPYDLPKET